MTKIVDEIAFTRVEELMKKKNLATEQASGAIMQEQSDSESSIDSFRTCENEPVLILPEELEEEVKQGSPLKTDRSITMISEANFLQKEFPWRTTLPVLRPPKQKFSIWAVVKEAIGKDLGRISVPVYFNEPVSMLQRTAEIMEYYELLDKADLEPNPYKRIAYITAFEMAQYCNLDGRALKPFNPVLGETYDLLTKDFRFMSEQVSHHPPVSAFHGYNEHFECYSNTEVNGGF